MGEEPESGSSIFNVTLELPPLLSNYVRHVSGFPSSKLKKNRGSAIEGVHGQGNGGILNFHLMLWKL